jgi:hypothetical protein
MIGEDIKELVDTNEALKKVPGYTVNNATELSNNVKISKMSDWQLKLNTLDASELDAFEALRKLDFKSNHIVEMFGFKKISKV